MTLVRPIVRSIVRGIVRGDALDADAAAYIAAVQAADGQGLEPAVKQAYTDFIVGCKEDGIWNAIKASCIMAGARTLTGALVPLRGAAPTNNNFVSGDYNRKTGLVGNGSTKFLDSNRNNNADPQNDNHNSVFINEIGSQTTSPAGFQRVYMGADHPNNGSNVLSGATGLPAATRSRTSTLTSLSGNTTTGFLGTSRQSSGNYTARHNSASTTINVSSNTPDGLSIRVFARQGVPTITDARLSFYSIGESLDLAKLDARVTALMSDLAFFFNTGLDPKLFDDETVAITNKLFDAGGTVTGAQTAAIDTFVRTGKGEGWYSLLRRFYLPIWGAAGPNAVDWITRGSGEFKGGVTPGAGFVQSNGTNGYFDTGVSPTTLGITTSSGHAGILLFEKETRTAVRFFLGARNSNGDGSVIIRQNPASSQVLGAIGRTGAEALSILDANPIGVIGVNRNANGVRSYKLNGSSLAQGPLVTTQYEISTANLFFLALNESSPVLHTDAKAGAFWAGIGIESNDALLDFSIALQTLWQTCTGLTLP